jgi:hypothetical protein
MQIIGNRSDALPPFFLNSIPKSGTHLILQIIKGIPHITHDPEKHLYEGINEQVEPHYHILKEASLNECVSGHMYCLPEWAYMFTQLNMKMVFLSRDLRDILVSYVYFVKNIPSHPFYSTDDEFNIKHNILQLINGIPEIGYPKIDEYYRKFLGWMKQSNVLTVTFEDLMISDDSKVETIHKLVEFLWEGLIPAVPLDQMIKRMADNIKQNESPTFRNGKIGGWHNEFDDEIKEAFKAVAGDLLIELGYEKNYNW